MAASTAIKIIKKLVTRELRKQSNKPKIPKVSAKEARELAEREVGPKGRRLVSIEAKDKYGKPIKGSPPITDNKRRRVFIGPKRKGSVESEEAATALKNKRLKCANSLYKTNLLVQIVKMLFLNILLCLLNLLLLFFNCLNSIFI